MRRLDDLNCGVQFDYTAGLVGSAPYKLGNQMRQGPADIEMNPRAIYHHTGCVGPSRPLHMGHPTHGQEMDRLQTSYGMFHGHENTCKISGCWGDKKVKPSSKRLLGGTNEDAEDLTGQRAPVSSNR